MPMAHRQLTMHRLLRGCSLRTVHCRLIKRTVPRAVLTDSEGCMRTYEELMEFIKEENVEFIRLAYFDVFGRQKNISIMAGELERAMRYGVSIDGSAIAGFDAEIRSDLFLRPDPSTLSIVPWRPTDGRVCRVFCDIVYPDGTPYEHDTRRLLKDSVQAAARAGVDVKFGSEMEFYVFRRDENGKVTDQPIDEAGYMDAEPLDGGENLRRDICYALVEMGITPESSHHERGPGQMEIDFRYSDPVTAADNTSTVKWAIQNRSHLIRIPADPSGNRRIELRSPDAGANPYLAFALLIYAGLRGIAEQLELPDTMEINLYKADRSVTDKLEQLPGTREEAAKLAAGSDFVRRYVPAACLEAYLNEKEI